MKNFDALHLNSEKNLSIVHILLTQNLLSQFVELLSISWSISLPTNQQNVFQVNRKIVA